MIRLAEGVAELQQPLSGQWVACISPHQACRQPVPGFIVPDASQWPDRGQAAQYELGTEEQIGVTTTVRNAALST